MQEKKKAVRGNPKRLALRKANLRRLASLVKKTKNPLDPAKYANMLNVHPSTARAYFKILAEQGLVQPVNYHPGNRRGRPAVFFQNAKAIENKS